MKPSNSLRSTGLKIALATLVVIAAVETLGRKFLTVTTPSQLEEMSNSYFTNAFGFRDLAPGPRNVKSKRRVARYSVNSLGYRSVHEIQAKAKGELRIVVLGGSFVFDVFSDQGEEWTSRLESRLRKDFPGVRVWNRGVPRASSHLALLRAVLELPQIEPDVVIYTGSWNDLQYFTTPLPVTSLPYMQEKINYFITPRGAVDAYLSEHSTAYGILRNVALKTFYLPDRVDVSCAPGTVPGRPLDAPLPGAVRQYETTLRAFQGAVENLAALPVLIVEPNLYFSQEALGRYNMPADYAACLSERGVYESLLKAREATLGLKGAARPVYDPSPVFAGDRTLLEDHLHLSSAGARLYSELVADFLKPLLKKRLSANGKQR